MKLYNFRVNVFEPLSGMVDLLTKRAELPGVLVEQNGEVVGMISRVKCFQLLGRAFGVEVFTRRPVAVMLENVASQPLTLPAGMRVDQAVQLALARAISELYEPIIVKTGDKDFGLLDLHILLLAQSQQLLVAHQLVYQQMEVARAISSTLELDRVLTLILENMTRLVPYENAALLLWNGDRLEHVAGMGFPAEIDAARDHGGPDHHPLFARVLNEGKPLVVDDGAEHPGETPAGAWLGQPLVVVGQVIGLLSITRKPGQGFQAEELTLAEVFASQAAVALGNARLFEETRRLTRELELKVQERTEELQKANDRLVQMDRTKNDLLHVISNELWRPINSISHQAQALMGDADLRVRPKLRDRLGAIAENVNRLQHIVSSMIDVAKLNQSASKDVQIAGLLHGLNVLFVRQFEDRKVRLEMGPLEKLPSIRGDQDGLRKVFYQLILNAMQFTPDGGEIRVSGAHLPWDQNPLGKEAVKVTIADTGVGIAQEQQELIFASFYQETRQGAADRGLGLAIVRGIVESHQGLVWVESSGRDEVRLPGSKFHVLLPV